MRNPVTIPAALLFNDSLLITRPAARLRSGWMGLSVGLHLLAGSAVLVAPLFRVEKLEPPVIQPLIRFPVLLGGYTPPPPKGDPHGSVTKDASQKQDPGKILKVPPLTPPALTPPEVVQASNEPGAANPTLLPYGDPTGELGGPGKVGVPGSGDPTMPPGSGGGGSGGDSLNGIFSAVYPPTDPPVLVSRVEPLYPEYARSQGIEGWVFLEIVIDENGQVADSRIVRSDNAIFNSSALSAVRRWKYTSPRNDRRAVKVYKSVGIKFTLH